ncbi:MAG: hypothetical protein JWO32_314 [Bacteroidetes bacterium]|nr:hypothetical protein [Bacteroidota bacterium]
MIGQLKNIFNQHLLVVITFMACLVVYFKFLYFGHISWDDPEMVFKNKAVRDFDLKALFTNHYVGNYIPVTMLFHSLTWQLFENNDGAHHLVNIAFHLLNGILVYAIGNKIFKNNLIANTGMIIFLLHPLQVESVAWISELKNILSTTFYLGAVLSYIQFLVTKKSKFYFFTLLLFILGCLSKSSVVILPLILLITDVLIHQTFRITYFLNKLPFLALSVLFGLINIKAQTADQFINYSHAFSYLQRIALAGYALIKYLLLFIFPSNLSVIYPYPELKSSVLITGFIFLFLITALIIFLIKRKKINLIGLILFVLINLVLVLQFVPFGEVLFADRYMYVAIIGFGWITGFLFLKIKIKGEVFAYTLILVFSMLTFFRAAAWKSAIILYEDILKKYPDQFIALNSAGVESMMINEDEHSLEYFNKAVKAAPRNYKGYYNRGLLYLKNNKPDLAIKSFNQALELYDYNKAYVARASAYYMLQDLPKAINDIKHVLQSDENNIKAHFVLGNCYNDLNKLDEAMKEYNKCIELNKDEAEYYFKRAITYGKKQDFNSCLNDLTLCIELKPEFFEAYFWRGVAKVNLKQDACADFRIAARNNVKPAVDAFNKYCR